MSKPLVFTLGLVAFVVLCLYGASVRAPAIEADILDRSSQSLAENGIDWASVAASGRDVVVQGTAPSEADRVEVGELAAGVRGVRVVDNQATVATITTDEPPAVEAASPSCSERYEDLIGGRTVRFDLGSAEIKSDSYGLLDDLAALASRCPATRFELSGFADSTGGDALNQRLSQARADAVKIYMVRKGIDAGRVSARGFGASLPPADNATASGRALNRRVELEMREN